MDAVLDNVAMGLDRVRAGVLRFTLWHGSVRAVFRNRAQRLMALYLLSAVSSLALSLFFPLVTLLLGPVVYGIPHLFAGLRYVDTQLSDGQRHWRGLHFFTALIVAVSTARLGADLGWMPLPFGARLPNLPELVATVVGWAGCAILYRRSWTRLLGAALMLAPLFYFSWKIPAGTIGALILLHNLIAFFFWIAAAPGPADRRTAIGATTVFVALTALVFSGAFDGLYAILLPGDAIESAGLDYLGIGKMIFPWSARPQTWLHATVAYAFGQSLHYFVWLKAIPDERHSSELPTSFRVSLRLARRDFGMTYFRMAVVAVALSGVVWAVVAMPTARVIYFAVAAYHGYLELVGLGWGLWRRTR